jgi:hypothetical protein
MICFKTATYFGFSSCMGVCLEDRVN